MPDKLIMPEDVDAGILGYEPDYGRKLREAYVEQQKQLEHELALDLEQELAICVQQFSKSSS
jgi:hypothetical protein